MTPRGARPSTGPEQCRAPRAGQELRGGSRPPLAATSRESEGPFSPLIRRGESACREKGRCDPLPLSPILSPNTFRF
jgi:hypothetical protein